MAMDQVVAAYLANRTRCFQCKKQFDAAILIPAGCGEHNCVAINPSFLWHMYETHGIPEYLYREWLIRFLAGGSPSLLHIHQE
jgi:hypothetical protein